MNKKLLVVCLVTAAAILGLIVLMAVEINSARPKLNKSRCGISHEAYGKLMANSRLGNYSKYAVAVDSVYCATVGK
jgi:hypothetical protein